jgi:hypothetical protein
MKSSDRLLIVLRGPATLLSKISINQNRPTSSPIIVVVMIQSLHFDHYLNLLLFVDNCQKLSISNPEI